MALRVTRQGVGGGRSALIVTLVLLLVSGCAGYGGEKVESPEGAKIKSQAEHCQLTLPQGWTWRPAAWAATSPGGTEMAFMEHLYGRPEHPTWEEAKAEATTQAVDRGATVADSPDFLRLDFGPQGGLSIIQRFDRVGCQLTFSAKPDVRADEEVVWQQIIDSLERITPTG